MPYEQIQQANAGFLSGGIVSGATTLAVTLSGVNFPVDTSGTFRVIIDKEILRLQGGTPPVFNIVEQGAEGTTIAAHNTFAQVSHVITPQGAKNLTGGVNDRPGTSYTVGTVDARGLITMSNGSAIALAIPQASTSDLSGFGPHFWFGLVNGGLGLLTATPTTSLVNGAATFTLRRNQHAVVFSDGTNYAAYIVGENAFVTSGSYASGQVNWTTLSSGTVRSGHAADGSINSGNIGSGSIAWVHTASGFVRSGGIADGAVNSGNLASGIVAWPHMASGAVRSGILGDASVVSGSIASGVLSQFAFASGVVTSGIIGDAAVNSGNVGSGQLGWVHFSSGAVRSGNVANDAVNSGNIASGIIGTVHLADGSVTSGDVASGSISWPHHASGAVRSGHIANDAVNSGNIASGAVGHMQISDNAVQSGNIQSGRVFSLHLQSGTIFAGAGIGVTIYESGITLANLSGAGGAGGTVDNGLCEVRLSFNSVLPVTDRDAVGNAAYASGRITSGESVFTIMSGYRNTNVSGQPLSGFTVGIVPGMLCIGSGFQRDTYVTDVSGYSTVAISKATDQSTSGAAWQFLPSAIYAVPYNGDRIALNVSGTWTSYQFTSGQNSQLRMYWEVSGCQIQSGPLIAAVSGIPDTFQLTPGMLVVASSWVPSGTIISTIDSATSITMNANSASGGSSGIVVLFMLPQGSGGGLTSGGVWDVVTQLRSGVPWLQFSRQWISGGGELPRIDPVFPYQGVISNSGDWL